MKRLAITAILATIVALSGCASAPVLAPGPETKLAEGGPGAVASAAGVRVTATVDRWRWNPSDLDEFVTPILLRVENDSERPVRVRLEDIRLVGKRGVYLAALPPYRVRGRSKRTVRSHAYGFEAFSVAPYLHPYYPWYPRSRFHFYHDHFFYYRTYYPVYRTYSIPLPTQEMLERALPEGTVNPGGTAMGFVYFERVDRDIARRTRRLNLLFQVVDAETQEELGVASIGFDLLE